MLDIQFIREHAKEVKKAAQDKQLDANLIDKVLKVDEDRRELINKVDKLRAEKNKLTKEDRERGRAIKAELKEIEPQLRDIEEKFTDLMYQVPNLPAKDVPIGEDETGNKVVKTWGDKPTFDFKPQPHHKLAQKLDLSSIHPIQAVSQRLGERQSKHRLAQGVVAIFIYIPRA